MWRQGRGWKVPVVIHLHLVARQLTGACIIAVMRLKFVASAAICALFFVATGASSYPAGEPKQGVTLSGKLAAGRSYEHGVGRNLVFRLAPSPASFGKGWDIEIVPEGKPGGGYPEYAALATPPYHLYKSTYLNASYGVTAQEAVAMSPRKFYFVETPADSQTASVVVNTMVYSIDWQTRKASLEASAAKIPVGVGELKILQSRITPGRNNEDLGSIDWIKFQVTLRLDSGATLRDVLFAN